MKSELFYMFEWLFWIFLNLVGFASPTLNIDETLLRDKAFDVDTHLSMLNQFYQNNTNLFQLNCSQWLSNSERNRLEEISKFPKYSNQQDNPISVEILHNCMRANPYNTKQLPLREIPPPFYIKFGLCVTKVISLGNDGSLSMKGMLHLMWWDYHRLWNTRAYIANWKYPDVLTLPASEVWVPSFTLNGCEERDCTIKPDNESQVSITNNGLVSITKAFLVHSTCELFLHMFPFDTSECQLVFVFDASHINSVVLIQNNNLQFDFNYYDNEEWHLRLFTVLSPCTINKYYLNGYLWYKKTRVKALENSFCMHLLFRRNAQFYMFNLIAPAFVMTICGFCGTFLSSNSELKLEFLVGVLTGFIFVQTIVANVCPKSEYPTAMGKFVLTSLLLCLFNVVGAAIVLLSGNLDQKRKTPPPFILRFIFIRVYHWTSLLMQQCLCCVCCCYCCGHCSTCCRKSQQAPASVVTEVLNIEPKLETGEENTPNSENAPISGSSIHNELIDRTSENCSKQAENWAQFALNLNTIVSIIYAIGTIVNSYILAIFFLMWALTKDEKHQWYLDELVNSTLLHP